MQPKTRLRTFSATVLASGLAACLLPPVTAAGQPTLRAPQASADLALTGPLRIGDVQAEWGDIVPLDATGAVRTQAGHCRFRYRYQVTNGGPGAAGAHVNRLRLENGQVLAESAVQALAPGATRQMAGVLTLWSGEVVVYVELDAGKQVSDPDRGNNLRRIRTDLGEGCPDPRPGARPPIQPGGGPDPRSSVPVKTSSEESGGPGARPPGRGPGSGAPGSAPPPTASRGSSPKPAGNRAPAPQGRPAQEGRPASGTTSKPIPEEELHCRPRLTVERSAAVTQAGGLGTATAAWTAKAFELHGPGFTWNAARDRTQECRLGFGWTCTVSARPCRS